MKTPLEEKRSELLKISERIVEIGDMGDRMRDGSVKMADDEVKRVHEELDSLIPQQKALAGEVETLESRDDAVKKAGGLREYLRESANPMQFTLGRGGSLAPKKSIAEQILEDGGIKSWWSAHAPTGTLPNTRQVTDSPSIKLEGSIKALFTGTSAFAAPADVNAAAMIRPTFRGLVDETLYQTPLGIADMVTHEPTDSDIIFYARVPSTTSFTQAAAATAEATATGDASGAKPEGAGAFEIKEAIVRTIAIWIAVTRKALANAAQLQGVVDRYLRYEVQRALSYEILNGDNTGEHLLGILHLPNLLTQAFVTDPLVTTRKAITHLILAGRTIPTAWLFHPSDFETIDLQTDNELRYYFGGPGAGGGYGFGGAGETTGRVPTLWGVPVRQSEFCPAGTAILADWSRYIIADREETTVRVSDSHADFFTRNMLAILAELRAAGYAERDQAFETVSLA